MEGRGQRVKGWLRLKGEEEKLREGEEEKEEREIEVKGREKIGKRGENGKYRLRGRVKAWENEEEEEDGKRQYG